MEDYKEVVVYLTQKQAEQANQWIIQRTKAYQKSEQTKNYIYVHGNSYREWTRNEALLPWLNATDLNQEVYPTTHSKAGEPVPSGSQYIAKINEWVGYGYLKDSEAEELKDILLKSSGSYQENEWIYSISGTDNGRNTEETRLILDIHDRRLDDPNTTLEIKGNVVIGSTENPDDRKKFTVLGETELQDATGFGRVIDTYGEQNPDQWGHLIPDEAFPKVYINRGEDRFNGESWSDRSYGEGFGTIETTREIVSHTTVNADRGIIIEDGLGDETDKDINKNEDGNFYQDGERVHDTNGAALTINHDGFNVKGHSFIKDEVDKNKFYSKNEVIYSINAEDNSEVECTDIEEDCWFCKNNAVTNLQRDQQYGNWCIQDDGSIVLITDQWPGFLYHIVRSKRNLIPTSENPKENEKIYVYYGTDGKQYCFTYNAEANTWTQREILNEKPQEVNGYYTISDNYYFYKTSISEVKMEVIYVNTQDNPAEFNLKEGTLDLDGTFTADVAERVNPEIKKVYQIKEGYIWDSYSVGNKTRKQVTHEGGEFIDGDYLYWDGIYFRKVENIIDNDFSAGYGSFTIGTSASVDENGKDKIGQHALEVGTNVAAEGKNSVAMGNGTTAEGDNSVAMGDGTTATGDNSIAIGDGTTAEGNNSVVIGSDLTNNTEDSLMIGGISDDEHALSIHNSAGETAYITHNGKEWLNSDLEVEGTSDLKRKTTIGENLNEHQLALEVLHHSQFDEQVEVMRDSEDVDTADYLYPEDIIEQKSSLKVRGTSLFNDIITVGYDKESEEQPGTFWGNFNDTTGQSNFVGLNVHGEIKNERIPMELYTSTTINGNLVLNEFADKFFVNSSIATATATFRGTFTPEDYAPKFHETFLLINPDIHNIISYPFGEPKNYAHQIVFDYYDEEVSALPEVGIVNKIYKLEDSGELKLYTNIGTEEEPEYGFKTIVGTVIADNSYGETLYHKYTYESGSINPYDEAQVSNWLLDKIQKIDKDDCVQVYELPEAAESLKNYIYYLIPTDKYYKVVNSSSNWIWEEISQYSNNNDYCFFQIWENIPDNGNVLFATKYDENGNIINDSSESLNQIEGEANIICHRYKFYVKIHPATSEILEQKWKFEYQLNNSSFTQAQWNSINSGITSMWMNETIGKINKEIQDRRVADDNILATIKNKIQNMVKYEEEGSETRPIYLVKDYGADSDINVYKTEICRCYLEGNVSNTEVKNFSFGIADDCYYPSCYVSYYTTESHSSATKAYAYIKQYAFKTNDEDMTYSESIRYIATRNYVNIKLEDYCILNDNFGESGSSTNPIYLYKDTANKKIIPQACTYQLKANIDPSYEDSDDIPSLAVYYSEDETFTYHPYYKLPAMMEDYSDCTLASQEYVDIELNNYTKTTELNTILNNYVEIDELNTILNNYAAKTELAKIRTELSIPYTDVTDIYREVSEGTYEKISRDALITAYSYNENSEKIIQVKVNYFLGEGYGTIYAIDLTTVLTKIYGQSGIPTLNLISGSMKYMTDARITQTFGWDSDYNYFTFTANSFVKDYTVIFKLKEAQSN